MTSWCLPDNLLSLHPAQLLMLLPHENAYWHGDRIYAGLSFALFHKSYVWWQPVVIDWKVWILLDLLPGCIKTCWLGMCDPAAGLHQQPSPLGSPQPPLITQDQIKSPNVPHCWNRCTTQKQCWITLLYFIYWLIFLCFKNVWHVHSPSFLQHY